VKSEAYPLEYAPQNALATGKARNDAYLANKISQNPINMSIKKSVFQPLKKK
jgi:hypothetical protein